MSILTGLKWADLAHHEAVIEEFLISGAMPRDLCQVIQQRPWPRIEPFDWESPTMFHPINEVWRLN